MLENWLKPIAPDLLQREGLADFQFGKRMQLFRDVMPDLKTTQIALIGIGESEANAVREALYCMSFPFEGLVIADLGNVRKEDPAFFIPLIRELLSGQIFPVLIGRQPEQALAQYKAFQEIQRLVSLLVVDERIALNDRPGETQNFLTEIIHAKRSALFHLALLGVQTHFVPPAILDFIEQSSFECIRLGKAKADLTEVEPIVRDCDMLCFNLSALKQSEAPGQEWPTPSGFTTEEACQICYYAGMSDKLKSFGVYGFHHETDQERQTAQVVAQMVWYLISGFYNRKSDYPVSNEGLVEYMVDFKDHHTPITFWKSAKSGRWWVQAPVKSTKKYQRHRLIPCSYNDYRLACQEELPDRLVEAFRRFS
ncbi:MAG: arginase family protein [Saprospiraceae bacterium]|nr:arginase family protein [Saprospiraceae bacterium]